EPAIVHDTLKLCHGFHKTVYGFFIPDFFRDKRTFTKRTEVALHTHPLFGSLRKEQVAIMVQKRSLVKMTLVGLCQKTLVISCQIGSIVFFDVPILFVNDR